MALLADHLEWNSFLKRAHIFSIGFKSGEFGGQAMGEMLKDLRNSKVELLLCIGALSCMKIKEEGRSWVSKKNWYKWIANETVSIPAKSAV